MIKSEILSIIESLIIDDLIIKLPSYQGKMDENIFKELKNKMINIGGVWKTNKQGWLFKIDPTPLLDQLKSGKDVNIFQDHQFFFTPRAVFDFLIDWPNQDYKLELPTKISISNAIKFLEPEAGEGHILDYFKDTFGKIKFPVYTHCCESMPRNIEILRSKGYEPIHHDFLSLDKHYDGYFDLIIANPPFSNNQYIKHIMKMYDVTKEGGTIFTVAPNSYTNNDNRVCDDFRFWLKSVHAMEKPIPPALFKENKAGAKCNAIWIDVLYS